MHYRTVSATFAVLACLFLLSCNKQAKIRKLTEASKDLLQEARQTLLRKETLQAKTLALKAKKDAERALSLAKGGPHETLVQEQFDKALLFSDLFEKPKAAVRFWFQAMADEDVDIVVELFDTSYILERLGEIRKEKMTPSSMKALYRAFDASCERTADRYADVMIAWHWLDITSEVQGQEAIVKTTFKVAGSPMNMNFWLRKGDGLWRPIDFSLEDRRASDILWDLAVSVNEEMDFADLFRDKGVFEAFSVLREAEKYGRAFLQKPLLGHYVRVLRQVQLERQGKPVLLKEGRILRVMDQLTKEDRPHVMVRTTEADPEEWCTGFIPEEAVEHIGTDETEIWGVG